jgi:peroxidase
MAPANYCNGRDSSRCKRNGGKLPNPRVVSLFMQRRTTDRIPFSRDRTRLLADWGQFVTHDMIQTPDLAGGGPDPCDCKRTDVCDNIHTPNDPVIKFPCFFVVKSVGRIGRTGAKRIPTKEQVNQLSGFIDGTNVYGFTKAHLEALRKDNDGNKNHKLFLPSNGPSRGTRLPHLRDAGFKHNGDIVKSFRTEPFLNEKGLPSPVAGDTRCAENVMLTSWHTTFARLHNFLADGLKSVMDTNNDDHVFFEARQVNIAIMNWITYNEFLPAVLGENIIERFELLQLQKGTDQTEPQLNSRSTFGETFGTDAFSPFSSADETDYEDSEDFVDDSEDFDFFEDAGVKAEVDGSHRRPSSREPSIRNEFAAALFRWGHSMQPNLIQSRNKFFQPTENRLMRANWFDPQMLARQSPARMIRGGMMVPGVDPGPKWIDDTVHFFFQPAGAKSGIDLMSINIQRGRDHGVNSFTAVRKACMQQGRFRLLYKGAKMKKGWSNIVKLYGSVSEVDLYVGMLMEEPVFGSKLGPTSICSVVDQFVALKTGDRHWFENSDMFSKDQLQAIKDLSLSNVFCKTMTDEDFTVSHTFPFIQLGRQFKGQLNRRVACSSFKDFNFNAWKNFKPKPTSPPSVLGSAGADIRPPPPSLFDTKPPAKQSAATLRSVASKTRCANMFNTWQVDTNTVGIKCEEQLSVVHLCRAFCLNPSHSLVAGSISSGQCRAGNFKHAKIGKDNVPFSRCAPPKKANQTRNIRTKNCGLLVGGQKSHGISGGAGVEFNCKGNFCFPTCDDPNKEPTQFMFECRPRGRRSFVIPNRMRVECVDKKPRTHISKCGDLSDPSNTHFINNIDHTSVEVNCHDDFCRLRCKSSLTGFMPSTHDWKHVLVRCVSEKLFPNRVQAECAAGQKTSLPGVSLQEEDDEETQMKKFTKCDNTIFEQYGVSENLVNVNCGKKKCKVKCKDGSPTRFIWPDGASVRREMYQCKGGTKWQPPAGQITCS